MVTKLGWRLESAAMPAEQMQLFGGKVQVLRLIIDFLAGEGSAEAHAALHVWRVLSRAERHASDATARLASVADQLVLRFSSLTAPAIVGKKLDFYTDRLKVRVKELTIKDSSALSS